MATLFPRPAMGSAICLLMSIPGLVGAASAQETAAGDQTVVLDTIVLSAEDQIKQSLGVSNITAEDLEIAPVANDISQIVRRMPGVNLTGSTATGQRGNQRQIDLRGMGPENTLILIDGRPVMSRNSVRMGRSGERDARGDSNWVPAELIERIEVIRGPAAARYGSGAAGGVVNIVTRRPTEPTLSFGAYVNAPENSMEGGDYRANFLFARPLGADLTFRLTGNYSKSDGDDPMINAGADTTMCEIEGEDGSTSTVACPAAGVEGVVNKDATALLSWQIDAENSLDFEAGISRQGNIFAGDRQNTSVNDVLTSLFGEETNVMLRKTFAVTHRGNYDFGTSQSYLQYERTDNRRMVEGLAGGPEGSITDTTMGTIKLENITAKSEWVLPLTLAGRDASLTLGGELRHERLNDAISNQMGVNGGSIPGTESDPALRDPEMTQLTAGLYAEANIYVSDRLTLTPGLRLDHGDTFGFNASPSLNASFKIDDAWTMKVGVARAFKAPNLYQLNPNYVYYTRGRGCPVNFPSLGSGCYVVGNADLEPETSINAEIGLAFDAGQGLQATLTAFHNDYRDKIQAGLEPVGTFPTPDGRAQYFQWINIPKAVVAGVEGSLSAELSPVLNLTTNFTYMAKSENKETGDPLSLVPEYTINAALDWQVNDRLTVTPSLTHYGRIDSPERSPTTQAPVENPRARDPYTIVNLGLNYRLGENARLGAGVTNVFDETVLREGSGTSAGANTFNEPGRAFYMSLQATL
ncbi:FepA family TonB-dependent siderophore receptor [Paracoccus sp. (in: a-proteobacteria)]|uniref:FepA family TonB-dependent siderophore receptor n=1 Tax=Paracoccus sp. TaxID=267 RepID=UPI003220512F